MKYRCNAALLAMERVVARLCTCSRSDAIFSSSDQSWVSTARTASRECDTVDTNGTGSLVCGTAMENPLQSKIRILGFSSEFLSQLFHICLCLKERVLPPDSEVRAGPQKPVGVAAVHPHLCNHFPNSGAGNLPPLHLRLRTLF